MRRFRVRWILFPSHLILAAASVLTFSLIFDRRAERALQGLAEQDLVAGTRAVAAMLAAASGILPSAPNDPRAARADSLLKAVGAQSGIRFTLVNREGFVLGDTERVPALLELQGEHPEFRHALDGELTSGARYSPADQERRLFATVPVHAQGTVVAVLEASFPMGRAHQPLEMRWQPFLVALLGAVLVGLVLSLVVARTVARPLETLGRASERFSRGNLAHRVPLGGAVEVAALAEQLNKMADLLSHHLQDVEQRHQEQAALLASMAEGVIAVDAGSRLLSMNDAARGFFDLTGEVIAGRLLHEAVRSPQLTRFVSQTLGSPDLLQAELVAGDRTLAASGAALRSADGERMGAIVVLNDVTRSRRAEAERRELVANVSHELRTPVTAIKGFLETLQSGALENPDDAARFVAIALRQANRLHAMVEDLLSLARIERGIEHVQMELETQLVEPVLVAALQTAEATVRDRRVRVEVDCPPELTAPIHADLLEQAVTNLLTNAARYSEPGSTVRLSARELDGHVAISVRDEGCGIAAEHHERLFERFYTVDRGRSRKTGGTGLGLSIVKHVARAHGGDVRVESTPGVGSVFTLYVPLGRGAHAAP